MPYRSGSWSLSDVRTAQLNDCWGPDSIVGEPGCLFVWGANECGQLGDGTIFPRSSPTQVPGTNWIYVSAGDKHAAGIKADGSLWTWGEGCQGQLGDNNSIPRSSPVQVPGSWICLGAGGQHTAAIKNDNTLWVWGFNQHGQLGDNCVLGSFPRSSPVQIPGTNWLTVTMASNSTYATTTTGCLFVWGHNNYGQLGLNDVVDRSSPTQLPGTTWQKVASGHCHILALKTDASLWVWGDNYYGQLGISTSCLSCGGGAGNPSPNRSSPIQLGGAWHEADAGKSTSHATDTLGNYWAWGHNSVGQLGGCIPSGVNCGISSPVVINGSCWKNVVTAGANHVVVLSCCNLLYSSGNNSCGQLGRNNLTCVNALQQRTSINTWTTITSFGDSSYGIKC